EMRKTALGIYQFDGDTLKLCLSIDPAKVSERPAEFAAKAGAKRVVLTLRRLTGAELPDSPRGTFALPKGGDGAGWAITLDGKSKFVLARDGKVRVEGTYRITGDQIEFTDVSGEQATPGADKTGTYRWRLAGCAL